MSEEQGGRRARARLAGALAAGAIAAVVLAGSIGQASADDVFGPSFGVEPINGGTGTQAPPALPGLTHAFWAGTCDRATAPPPGQSIAGGLGTRPVKAWVPEGDQRYDFRQVDAPAVAPHCLDWGVEAAYPCSAGVHPCPATNLWRTAPPPNGLPAWRLAPVRRAGAHPDVTAMFHLARNRNDDPTSAFPGFVDGAADNVIAELPTGFGGDPTAVPKCTAEQFAVKPLLCPPQTQVGILHLRTEAPPATAANIGNTESAVHPVYNLEPRHGNLAEFGVAYLSNEQTTTARIVAKARTQGDFGVTTFVSQLPAVLPIISQQITLWGIPWAASNDLWRAPQSAERIPREGLAPADRRSYDPTWGAIRPFISNPTECTGAPLNTRLLLSSYEDPAPFDAAGFPAWPHPNWKQASVSAPSVTACDKPPFAPSVELDGTSPLADAPSGLSARVRLPANDDPPAGVASNPDDAAGAPAHWRSDAGLASAQLRSAVVTLPEGLSVNPSGATGLEACSDEQFGMVADGTPPLFDNDDPFDGKGAECPAGSRLGKVSVDTPVLEQPLDGDLVLGTPRSTDPQSGQMFRLFIVARSVERGLVAKVAGSAVADPGTGRLTTTFAQNPRVPFELIDVRLKGGERGALATPPRCGSAPWSAALTPWTAPQKAASSQAAALDVSARCASAFAPSLLAGSAPRTGGGHGAFTLRLGREDGDQWLAGASVRLPRGLLAAVGQVPLCTDAQASADACPAASRIGSVDASAGAGDPFVLERKGAAYLTEGYKGAPYGMAVSVPVEAGPFRGQFALGTIVVRQALRIDPDTAEVTAVSDPLPLIHHGIPLRARSVTVTVDRPRFVVNPTDCSRKQVEATLTSAEGATSVQTQPFYASGCASLPFRPKLGLRLTGRRQVKTGKHPGVRATLTQPAAQAGIEQARVRLPSALALDPENAQALCEFEEGTKPDLERRCPKGSIIGRARAVSPLLGRPLAGDVYFVKNVRIDERTGNRIRTLPMIVVALRGEVAINVRGESSTSKRGALVSTFASLPDAPISRFELSVKGGSNGILAVTRTRRAPIRLCARPKSHVAEVDMDGHNGRRHDFNRRMTTPCPKATRRGGSTRGSR
jgi:hypothetical protein